MNDEFHVSTALLVGARIYKAFQASQMIKKWKSNNTQVILAKV
jgi:hypothetical protein